MTMQDIRKLDELFIWSCAEHASRTAWVRRRAPNLPNCLTYADLRDCVAFQSLQLKALGVGKGGRVGVSLPNGPEWAIAAFAVWAVGGVVVPLHASATPEEMAEQLAVLKPECVFTDAQGAGRFPMPVLNIDLGARADGEVLAPQGGSEHDLAALFYTSGSTGKAKIVQLSHRNFASNAVAVTSVVETLDKDDRFMALLPYSHAMGLTVQLLLPVFLGASIVAPQKLAAKEILGCLVEENVSAMIAVPQLYRNMMLSMEKKFHASSLLSAYVGVLRAVPLWLRCILNKPLLKKFGPVKVWASGGSRLDPEITRYFHGLGIPLRQGYGLTETSPLVSATAHFDPAHDAVGHPADGVEVRLEPIEGQDGGELWVRGPNVMLGYTDPELTAEVMVGDWFRTGDLASIDGDGKITIIGRSKRVIVTPTGKNVFPEDLEIMLEQEEWVKEACVVELNQHPAALVALDETVTDPAQMLETIVHNFNHKVSPHKKIHKYVLCENLPRTPLGKIALVAAQEQVAEHFS